MSLRVTYRQIQCMVADIGGAPRLFEPISALPWQGCSGTRQVFRPGNMKNQIESENYLFEAGDGFIFGLVDFEASFG